VNRHHHQLFSAKHEPTNLKPNPDRVSYDRKLSKNERRSEQTNQNRKREGSFFFMWFSKVKIVDLARFKLFLQKLSWDLSLERKRISKFVVVFENGDVCISGAAPPYWVSEPPRRSDKPRQKGWSFIPVLPCFPIKLLEREGEGN